MKESLCLCILLICATAATAQEKSVVAVAERPLCVITRPTIVAFFPPVDTSAIDEDTNELLADFQTYTARVRMPLRKAGSEFHELYARSFRIRVGRRVRTFHPGKVDVGYVFITPGGAPRVEYGVRTDDDLLRIAQEYFRIPSK
jgi:hypothetical protein